MNGSLLKLAQDVANVQPLRELVAFVGRTLLSQEVAYAGNCNYVCSDPPSECLLSCSCVGGPCVATYATVANGVGDCNPPQACGICGGNRQQYVSQCPTP